MAGSGTLSYLDSPDVGVGGGIDEQEGSVGDGDGDGDGEDGDYATEDGAVERKSSVGLLGADADADTGGCGCRCSLPSLPTYLPATVMSDNLQSLTHLLVHFLPLFSA